MFQLGYTLSSEEHDPNTLVKNAALAEQAGFAFASISDHFHPWIDAQGQSPFAFAVIGAISQVTKTLKVGTGVTCPIIRYHPAIVAQAAATCQILMEGRFYLGLGTGENLNEHIVGKGWPPIDVRLDMFKEAVTIIKILLNGGTKTYWGKFFNLDSARIYTMPEVKVPLMIASSGKKSANVAGKLGDGFISTSPSSDLIKIFEENGGKGKPKFAQVNVCFDKSKEKAKEIVKKLWPNSSLPDPLNTELRIPSYFENAVKAMPEEKLYKSTALGDNPEEIIKSIQKYQQAGFDHVYIHNIGPNQLSFIQFAQKSILPFFKDTSYIKSDTKVKTRNIRSGVQEDSYYISSTAHQITRPRNKNKKS